MSRHLAVKFGLTDKQAAFAVAFVAFGDPRVAAREAGYSSLEESSFQCLRHPLVVAAIREEQQRRLITEGAQVGFEALIEIAGDKKAAAPARVAAAKALVDRAGFVPPTIKDEGSGKALSDMTPAELRRFIEDTEKDLDHAESIAAARAIPVNAPGNAPTLEQEAPKLQELLG